MSGLASQSPPARKRTWAHRLLVLEAMLALVPAGAAVRLVGFQRLVKSRLSPLRPRRAVEARWYASAVRSARTWVPWSAVCFESALALRTLLRRRGIPSVLHYGIARDGDAAIKAHVWLSVDGVTLIGGEVASEFAEVATFSDHLPA